MSTSGRARRAAGPVGRLARLFLARNELRRPIRYDEPIMLRQRGDLVTPGVPGLREAVEQDHSRAFPRFYEVHA